MRRTGPEKAKAIKMVLKDGKSQASVAAHLGVPPQTVNSWIKAKESELEKVKVACTPLEVPIASITFGTVLANLRRQKTSTSNILSQDDFARRLLIGASTLRMIESGKHPPTSALAYVLAIELKIPFPMMVLVIGFVRAIDSCETMEMVREVAQEFGRQEPRFGFFSRRIIDATYKPQEERKVLLQDDALVVQILDLLRSPVQSSLAGGITSDPILSDLSPVLRDAIRALSSKLHFFNPALDPPSLNKWESENSHRIRRVWSYYKDPTRLCETLPQYKLEFLNEKRPIRPQYVVIIQDPDKDYKKVSSTFRDLLKNHDKNLVMVNEKPLSEELNKEFIRALSFDLNDGFTCLSQGDVSVKEYTQKYGQGRYLEMTTINCYELEDATGVTYCAFIDNSKSLSKKSGHQLDYFYARALKPIDNEKIRELFKHVGDELKIKK